MAETDTDRCRGRLRHKGNRGLSRLWMACRNSWSGVLFAVREESAFRQELMLTACLIPVALVLPFNAFERLMLIGSLVLVLVVELLNSSIEAVVDRISFEHDGLSRRAKDYGSAAVTLTLFACAVVWITLIWRLFSG